MALMALIAWMALTCQVLALWKAIQILRARRALNPDPCRCRETRGALYNLDVLKPVWGMGFNPLARLFGHEFASERCGSEAYYDSTWDRATLPPIHALRGEPIRGFTGTTTRDKVASSSVHQWMTILPPQVYSSAR